MSKDQELILSAPSQGLATRLRSVFTEHDIKPTAAEHTVKDKEGEAGKALGTLLDGYTTVLRDGTERGVTAQDIEAVGNFKRDVAPVHRLVSGELGYGYMKENSDSDRYKNTLDLGPDLQLTAVHFRPGKELTTEETYSAITENYDKTDDFKAVSAHLAALAKSLTEE